MRANLANSYELLGRIEETLRMRREIYSGTLRLYGNSDLRTFNAANNYASVLRRLNHYAEAKALLRTTMPVARRILGDGDTATLTMRWNYATTLLHDTVARLSDFREAVTIFEDMVRITRRMLGGAHPYTKKVISDLEASRVALRAAETQHGISPGSGA